MPPGGIDPLRRIEFAEALGLLQSMIGGEVQVVVNLLGYFFDCGFHARLQRVETLSSADGPILIVFERAQGIALDPDELESFAGRMPGLPTAPWLEFHVAERLWLTIEPLAQPVRG